MKKRTLLALCLLSVLAGAFTAYYQVSKEHVTNERGAVTITAPSYFLEPKGYIIAEVVYTSLDKEKTAYGYISIEDYSAYITGDEDRQVIKILNPYIQNGKSSVAVIKNIKSLTVGEYKDKRSTLAR